VAGIRPFFRFPLFELLPAREFRVLTLDSGEPCTPRAQRLLFDPSLLPPLAGRFAATRLNSKQY
jgi:hypothetical protein